MQNVRGYRFLFIHEYRYHKIDVLRLENRFDLDKRHIYKNAYFYFFINRISRYFCGKTSSWV